MTKKWVNWNENELINEYIPQEEIKNLIQEDLPFIKAENIKSSNKFKLPEIDLLKIALISLSSAETIFK